MIIAELILAILGVWAAFLLVGYAIYNVPAGYERIRFFAAVLLLDIFFASITFYHPILSTLILTFAFTKCMTWSIMNPDNMVHLEYSEDDFE